MTMPANGGTFIDLTGDAAAPFETQTSGGFGPIGYQITTPPTYGTLSFRRHDNVEPPLCGGCPPMTTTDLFLTYDDADNQPGIDMAELKIIYGTPDGNPPSIIYPAKATIRITTTSSAPVVNGACGSANGSNFSSKPTSNLCSAGTASNVSGGGPWSWTCAGSNGGTNSPFCNAGVIGTPTNSCVAAGAPWDCYRVMWVEGGNAGNSAGIFCVAQGDTPPGTMGQSCGVLGASATDSQKISTVTNPTFSDYPSGGYDDLYRCAADCAQAPPPSCGSANNVGRSSAPTSNLCETGTASAVTGTGPWNWTCTGTGAPANCSAPTSCPAGQTWNGTSCVANGCWVNTHYQPPSTSTHCSDVAGFGAGSSCTPLGRQCYIHTAGTGPSFPIYTCNTSCTGGPSSACGSANNVATTANPPSSNLCTAGNTASTPSRDSAGLWSWTCTGVTAPVTCTAPTSCPAGQTWNSSTQSCGANCTPGGELGGVPSTAPNPPYCECTVVTATNTCDKQFDNENCTPVPTAPSSSYCAAGGWEMEEINGCPGNDCTGWTNTYKFYCGSKANCGSTGCSPGTTTGSQACTGGRSGNMTRTRTTNVASSCGINGEWSAWNESGCTCPAGTTWDGSSCVTVCTESMEEESQPCGDGYVGNMTRTRTDYTANNCSASAVYTEWNRDACEPVGECGTDSGKKFYADTPPSALCKEGTPSEISGTFSWTCKAGTQDPISCSAELKCRTGTQHQSKSCATKGYLPSPGSIVRSRPTNIDEVCGTYGDWTTWDESSCRFPSAPVTPPEASCPIEPYSRPDLMAAFGPRHWERVVETGQIECVKNMTTVGPCAAIERRILAPVANGDDRQRQQESCVKDTSCMPRIDARCGGANGSTVTSAPTSGLCAAGEATDVTGTGPWKWSCSVKNTATTVAGKAASCEAQVAPPAVVKKGGICEAP